MKFGTPWSQVPAAPSRDGSAVRRPSLLVESVVDGSPAMIGTTLGRYEILEVLGRGGQSIAYKARDPKINRMVALKQILSNKGQPEKERADFLTRFMREAQSAGRLSHPNIATIYDVGGDEEGEPYIAMEYVDGCDLDELIAMEHPLLQARILRIFVQLCSALEYAHNAGIVHRDIKPGNIMLTRDDRVKVVDFGIAKMDATSLTQAGMVMGTPHYMSPEQIMGKPVDRRSDIFSLGIVLYEALTGEKPFAGEHWTTVSFKIVHQRPSSVLNRKREPSLLPDFDRIVDRVMAKDPAERFQSCAELGLVLEDLLRDRRLISVPAPASPERPRPPPATAGVTGVSASTPKPGQKDQTAVTATPPSSREVISSVPSSGGPDESSDGSLRPILPALDTDGAKFPVALDVEPPDLTISNVGLSIMAEATAAPPASPRRSADGLAAVAAKRRSSVLLIAAALALIVALAFVVMAQIPGAALTQPTLPVAEIAAASMPAIIEPSAVEQSLRDARAAIDQGLYVSPDGNDALHFVTVALAAEPGNEDALQLERDIRTRALEEAEILRKRGRRNEVLAAYDLLLEHFPDDAAIQSKRDKAQSTISRAQLTAEVDRSRKAGDKAFAAGDYIEAARQFGNLVRIDPKNASAFYFLGRSNLARSSLAAATGNLTRACKLEPANPTYNIQLGRVLEKNKDFANALVYIGKGIELGGDPENSPAALKARAAELTFRMNLSRLTPQTLTSMHGHFFTRCAGKLFVTEAGISYVPDEKKEHAMQALWEDVARFEISGGKLVMSTAEKNYSFESSDLDRLTAIARVFAARH